jgi:hypothetical protein
VYTMVAMVAYRCCHVFHLSGEVPIDGQTTSGHPQNRRLTFQI